MCGLLVNLVAIHSHYVHVFLCIVADVVSYQIPGPLPHSRGNFPSNTKLKVYRRYISGVDWR